jgi:hypothetical protein
MNSGVLATRPLRARVEGGRKRESAFAWNTPPASVGRRPSPSDPMSCRSSHHTPPASAGQRRSPGHTNPSRPTLDLRWPASPMPTRLRRVPDRFQRTALTRGTRTQSVWVAQDPVPVVPALLQHPSSGGLARRGHRKAPYGKQSPQPSLARIDGCGEKGLYGDAERKRRGTRCPAWRKGSPRSSRRRPDERKVRKRRPIWRVFRIFVDIERKV